MRTPGWVWAINLAVLALAGWLAVIILREPRLWRSDGLFALGVLALAPGIVVLGLVVSRRYFIAGPAIELYADRLVVPRPWRGREVFPLADLTIERVRVLQKVSVMAIPTGVTLDRGVVATLRFGRIKRVLVDRVFPNPDALAWLLADASAVARGEPARGYKAWLASTPAKPHDDRDDDDDDTYEAYMRHKSESQLER